MGEGAGLCGCIEPMGWRQVAIKSRGSGGVKVQRTDEMEPRDCRWCTARCMALETCGVGPARGSRVLKAEGGAK